MEGECQATTFRCGSRVSMKSHGPAVFFEISKSSRTAQPTNRMWTAWRGWLFRAAHIKRMTTTLVAARLRLPGSVSEREMCRLKKKKKCGKRRPAAVRVRCVVGMPAPTAAALETKQFVSSLLVVRPFLFVSFNRLIWIVCVVNRTLLYQDAISIFCVVCMRVVSLPSVLPTTKQQTFYMINALLQSKRFSAAGSIPEGLRAKFLSRALPTTKAAAVFSALCGWPKEEKKKDIY